MNNESNELTIVAKESGLEQTKVEALLSNFGKSYAEAKELSKDALAIVVTEEDQTQEMQQARAKRLALKSIRVDVENTRKSLKEQSLREGKAIDGMSNIIKALIIPIEEHLEKQEKFAELKQAERRAIKLAERIEKLSQFVPDVSLYNLENMTDEAFDSLLGSSKVAFEDQKAAEAKAEADRITKEKADAEERERVRLENIKLKEEADKRELEIKKERKAREAAEAKIKADQDAKDREAAKAEQDKREALLAPDKEKLLSFADVIDALELPDVSNTEAKKLLTETKDFLDRISKNLRNKAKEL